jgi:NADH-quinone oxidoreductase subunit J
MIAPAVYTVLFWAVAAATVLFALAVVNTRKLLRAAVALMAALSTTAGLYVMLDAQFLAGVQILVYVGGIVVLIVFAIMLTRSGELLEDNPTLSRKMVGAVLSISFLALSGTAVWVSPFAVDAAGKTPDNDALSIGRALLDPGPGGYVAPFEVISLLLLAAMLGGIVIARKTPPPDQPFTSGGDLPGETDVYSPLSQRDSQPGGRAS